MSTDPAPDAPDAPGAAPAPTAEDEAVLLYLAALENRRAAPDTLPHPTDAAANLAGAEMMKGADEDALRTHLGEQTPGSDANVRSLEEDFVAAAVAYAQRHGTTYDGFRIAGVEPDVLARAGILPPDEQEPESEAGA